MLNIETERMIMSIEYDIFNGKIKFPENSNENINLLDLKPAPGVIFYEKSNNKNKICHINLSNTERRIEISYGVDNKEFEHQKYMKEAVHAFVNWFFSETSEMELHARIYNNTASQYIVESAGFVKNSKAKDGSTWFTLKTIK